MNVQSADSWLSPRVQNAKSVHAATHTADRSMSGWCDGKVVRAARSSRTMEDQRDQDADSDISDGANRRLRFLHIRATFRELHAWSRRTFADVMSIPTAATTQNAARFNASPSLGLLRGSFKASKKEITSTRDSQTNELSLE